MGFMQQCCSAEEPGKEENNVVIGEAPQSQNLNSPRGQGFRQSKDQSSLADVRPHSGRMNSLEAYDRLGHETAEQVQEDGMTLLTGRGNQRDNDTSMIDEFAVGTVKPNITIANEKWTYQGDAIVHQVQPTNYSVTGHQTLEDLNGPADKIIWMQHGQGEQVWAGTKLYSGQWFQGYQHGAGMMKWDHGGSSYEGEWKDGVMHGKGKMNWPDGRQYIGEFRNNMKHGNGVFTWEDGKRYDGGYRNDEQDGIAHFVNQDGVERNGQWEAGKRVKWLGDIGNSRSDQIDSQFDDEAVILTNKQIKELREFGEMWKATRIWTGTPEQLEQANINREKMFKDEALLQDYQGRVIQAWLDADDDHNGLMTREEYRVWYEKMLCLNLEQNGARWVHSEDTQSRNYDLIQNWYGDLSVAGIKLTEWVAFQAAWNKHVGYY